ncbi:unnamed protein product [Trifolium pratense]|uniref:Uncharacterized protein n=1 Tax=Trifolium pratense TaxID=57577 RepID=A0ACB0LXJ1_TRIPR|nr:unnamed protein product [Trifolium pratense]
MTMFSACCRALTHNHFLLSRSIALSPQPTALRFQSPSSLRLPPIRSPPPLNQLRLRHSRLSAFSDDGSGATGGNSGDAGDGGWNSATGGTGGDAGDGGWNSGDNESDDGGGNLSFLSCIAKKLEPMNTLASPVWWVFGFYCIAVGGQKLLEAALFLYCLTLIVPILEFFTIFPILLQYFTIFYIGMICIAFCIFPIIAYALRIREGASEDDIRSLPMYRLRIREGSSEDDIRSLPMYTFSQSNVMVMVDDNKKQSVKARTGSYNQSHISELSLHPDDSECCICLCPYVDGTELYRLPCSHHFHCACISRWLRTKATCPLCKFNIQRRNALV